MPMRTLARVYIVVLVFASWYFSLAFLALVGSRMNVVAVGFFSGCLATGVRVFLRLLLCPTWRVFWWTKYATVVVVICYFGWLMTVPPVAFYYVLAVAFVIFAVMGRIEEFLLEYEES